MPRTKKKTEEVLVKDLFKEIEVPSPAFCKRCSNKDVRKMQDLINRMFFMMKQLHLKIFDKDEKDLNSLLNHLEKFCKKRKG
ncbi:MAG TPA: hypothetical protein PLH46_00770 [Caldisericia bacterium]|nr:hypothetical protein [Caldisericia bacterium]